MLFFRFKACKTALSGAHQYCILIQYPFIQEKAMRVELIYDKRNVAGLPNAAEMIKAELTKRVHRVFPDAEVKVKPMQANGINTDANKQEKSVLNRWVEEMFDEADEWLVNEF